MAAYHLSSSSDQYAYLIVRCPRRRCNLAFIEYDRLNNRVHRVYPYPDTQASDFHASVPATIREDFAEAHRCYFGGSNKGVVVLCRRVLQLVSEDKGAEGSRLIDQIDDLLSKGLVTSSLHAAAHEVRYLGNFGAHPRDDGLDDIDDTDCKNALALVGQFLTDLYIRPYETARLSKRREEK